MQCFDWLCFFNPILPPQSSGCQRWCPLPLLPQQSHQMRDCDWLKVIQKDLLLKMGLNPGRPSANPEPRTALHWLSTCIYQHDIWCKNTSPVPQWICTHHLQAWSPVGTKFNFTLLALVSAFLITEQFHYNTNVIVFLPWSSVHRSPINFCLSRHVSIGQSILYSI